MNNSRLGNGMGVKSGCPSGDAGGVGSGGGEPNGVAFIVGALGFGGLVGCAPLHPAAMASSTRSTRAVRGAGSVAIQNIVQ